MIREEDRALTASKDSLRATRLAGFFGMAAFVNTEGGRKWQMKKRMNRDGEWGDIIGIRIKSQEARAYNEKNTQFQVKRLM